MNVLQWVRRNITPNSKAIFITLLPFIIALALFLGWMLWDKIHYTTTITTEQIPEVLGIRYTPVLPTEWDIAKVEKYDDGFTSPAVWITYKNGVTLQLNYGGINLSDQDNQVERKQIGTRLVDTTKKKKEVYYTFSIINMGYSVLAPIELQNEVESMIASLEHTQK